MKRVLLTMIVLLTTTIVFAQNDYQDVIYLKNGGVVRGIITEQIPNKSLKIQTAEGNVFVYNVEEVEKMTKERVVTQTPQNVTVYQPLSKEEIKQRMAVKAPHLYNKYQSASTLSTVGMCMTLGGLAIGTIGLAVADTETNAYTGETTYSGPGGAIGAIGMTCALVGTPIWIVGGVKKKKIRNSYLHLQQFDYSFHTPHSSPYLQVTTAPNKLGLALIF